MERAAHSFAPRPDLQIAQATFLTTVVSTTPRSSSWSRRTEDKEYLLMERAFACHGGMATVEEVVRRMRRHCDQPISQLAKWIVSRTALSVQWRSQTLLPLFQFDQATLDLRHQIVEISHEFRGIYDAWELCLWFATPNASLGDRAPVDVFMQSPQQVIEVAMIDRFVAYG